MIVPVFSVNILSLAPRWYFSRGSRKKNCELRSTNSEGVVYFFASAFNKAAIRSLTSLAGQILLLEKVKRTLARIWDSKRGFPYSECT